VTSRRKRRILNFVLRQKVCVVTMKNATNSPSPGTCILGLRMKSKGGKKYATDLIFGEGKYEEAKRQNKGRR